MLERKIKELVKECSILLNYWIYRERSFVENCVLRALIKLRLEGYSRCNWTTWYLHPKFMQSFISVKLSQKHFRHILNRIVLNVVVSAKFLPILHLISFRLSYIRRIFQLPVKIASSYKKRLIRLHILLKLAVFGVSIPLKKGLVTPKQWCIRSTQIP